LYFGVMPPGFALLHIKEAAAAARERAEAAEQSQAEKRETKSPPHFATMRGVDLMTYQSCCVAPH
jgi:hypothetical protein